MNRGVVVLLAVIGLLATAGAIAAGRNAEIAAPVSAVAIAAAGWLFLGAWDVRSRRGRPHGPAPPEEFPGSARALFASGRLRREALIEAIDRLERLGPSPALPLRSPGETDRLTGLSPEEFREYLRKRLDRLEGAT